VRGIPESILLQPLLAKCLERTSGYQFVSQVQNHSTSINGAVFPDLFKLGFSARKSTRIQNTGVFLRDVVLCK